MMNNKQTATGVN